MYLVAFPVILKIVVLLQPLFAALFLLFNIISEIIIDYNIGLILPPGRTAPLLRHWYIYIYIFLIKKIGYRKINFN